MFSSQPSPCWDTWSGLQLEAQNQQIPQSYSWVTLRRNTLNKSTGLNFETITVGSKY